MGYCLDFGLFLTNEAYDTLMKDEKTKEILSNMESKKTIDIGVIFSHTWLKALYLEESDLEKELKNLEPDKHEFCFMVYAGEDPGDCEYYTNYTDKQYESEYPYMWLETKIMLGLKDVKDRPIYDVVEEEV